MTGLKKNLDKCLGSTGRLSLVSKKDKLSVARQCELLKINRTSFYYTPVEPDRDRENEIKNRLDYWHTKMPYLGVRKLRKKLQEKDHIAIGRKLIKRYMDEMGIYAVCPKPNLSKRNKYNVPMKPDKIFEILSEPDIIKDRTLSGKKVHIKWEEDNFQLNSKRKLYWRFSRKKNRLANWQLKMG